MSDPTNETTVASAPVVQPAAATPAPTPVVPPAAKPPAPAKTALHAHVWAVLKKLEEVKAFAVKGFEELGVFIEHEAPVVAGVATAVANVVPGLGSAAAAVVGAVGKAAAVAGAVTSVVHPAPPKTR